MTNILNVTQPFIGQEGNLNRVKPQNPNDGIDMIRQITNPSKVTRPHDQNVYQDRQANHYSKHLESNFDKFLQTMRNAPGLTETYTEIFFSKMGNVVNSGISENFTQEIAKYMELIKMSDAELLDMLKGQQGQNLKFSGPFFDLLRQLVNSNVTNDLKISILDFLRKYDSMTSSDHIFNNILASLKNISARIPQSVNTQLNELIAQLSSNEWMGNNSKNLEALKNEIIPFLSRYIAITKDLGVVRNLIASLTLNVARYESGTKDSFMQSLRALTSYSEIGNLLQGVGAEELAARFMASGKNEGNPLVDQLINIIAKGMNSEAGYQNKAVFHNLVSSVLINESVYMPLLHYMLPANVNGTMFFSELWIDPNAEGEKGQKDEEGRAIKLLIKFDIRGVGFFETIILAQNGKVDMELYYPEKYASKELEIKDAMTQIMAQNSLSFRSLLMARCETPKSISEVFPKIYERRNAINVII